MALVRCPKHNIPYNDANPRGCPACAREKAQAEGATDQGAIMAELARASRRVEAITDVPPLEIEAPPVEEGPVVTRKRRPFLLYGIPAVLVLVAVVMKLTGPKFVEQIDPVASPGELRPISVFPGQPVTVLFAQLGVQPARPHPSARIIQRYQYGEDLIFDAVNDTVYSFEIGVPNRVWRGLRIGMPEQEAQGAVALLGTLVQDGPQTTNPRVVGGYLVFPSLVERPRRTISTQVRPPNGCYDVTVEVTPRTIGILVDGRQNYAAVGRRDDTPSWAVIKIQVVGRSVAGPLSGARAC